MSVSAGSRFDAVESKATKRPSAEITGRNESSFPLAPSAPEARLISVVVPACRSRTNASPVASVSSGCRFEAFESKATKRPPAEITGTRDAPLPLAPAAPEARLTSVVVLACRSRTNTSVEVSVSSGSRFDAKE